MNSGKPRLLIRVAAVAIGALSMGYLGTVFADESRQSVNAINSNITADQIIEALRPKPKVRGVKLAKENAIMILVTFDTGSSSLSDTSKLVLDEFGKAANGGLAGVTIVIEGHADPRGADDFNMDLSRQRAETVRDYLVRELKVDPKQLKVAALGKSHPKDPENPAAEINRRVEFVTQNLTN